jgi:Transposase DDE domain
MRAKLQTDEGRAIYARRKCITEPVHGLIKQARGFRQFLLRGLEKVQAEFALVALTHNLLKLWRAKVVGSAA